MSKDFLDNAVDKAKNLFSAACQKTDEVIAIEKLKVKQAAYKREISKNYKRLGKLYFDSLKDVEEAPESFKTIVKDIELNLALVEKAERDIDKIREDGVIL